MLSLRLAVIVGSLTSPLTGLLAKTPKFKALKISAFGPNYLAWCEVKKSRNGRVVIGVGADGTVTVSAFCPYKDDLRTFQDGEIGQGSLNGALGKALAPAEGWDALIGDTWVSRPVCEKVVKAISNKLCSGGDAKVESNRAGLACAGRGKKEDHFVDGICDIAYALSWKQERAPRPRRKREITAPRVYSTPQWNLVQLAFTPAFTGRYWVSVVEGGGVGTIRKVDGVKLSQGSLCGLSGRPVNADEDVTVTLRTCGLSPGVAYWAGVYVEDGRGYGDGTLSEPLALRTAPHNTSNFFLANPNIINFPTVGRVELNYTVAGSGRLWAAVVPEESSACVSLEQLKRQELSPQEPVECGIAGQAVTGATASVLSITGCSLARSGRYAAFVYVEDSLGLGDGTVSPPVTFGLGPSNTFVSLPYLHNPPTERELRVSFQANTSAGYMYASVVSKVDSPAVDAQAVKAGTYAVGGPGCRYDNMSIGLDPVYVIFNCSLERGKSYDLYMYVEDSYGLSDGSLSPAVEVAVPGASFDFVVGPLVSSSATRDGVTVKFTAAPTDPVWLRGGGPDLDAWTGKAWISIVRASAVALVDISNVKNATYGVGHTTDCRRSGVLVTNLTEVTLTNCSLEHSGEYVAAVYVESQDALHDGRLAFTQPFMVVAGTSNKFVAHPRVVTPVTSDGFGFSFATEEAGLYWAMVRGHTAAVPTIADIMSGVDATGGVGCRIAGAVVTVGNETAYLTGCQMLHDRDFALYVYVTSVSGYGDGSLWLPGVHLRTPKSNSFIRPPGPYIWPNPPSNTTVTVEGVAPARSGMLWMVVSLREDRERVTPATMKAVPPLYSTVCYRQSISVTAATNLSGGLNVFSGCGLWSGERAKYTLNLYVEDTLGGDDGTLEQIDFVTKGSNYFLGSGPDVYNVTTAGCDVDTRVGTVGKLWMFIVPEDCRYNQTAASAKALTCRVGTEGCYYDGASIAPSQPIRSLTNCSLNVTGSYHLVVYVSDATSSANLDGQLAIVNVTDQSGVSVFNLTNTTANSFHQGTPFIAATPDGDVVTFGVTVVRSGYVWAVVWDGYTAVTKETIMNGSAGVAAGPQCRLERAGIFGEVEKIFTMRDCRLVHGRQYRLLVYASGTFGDTLGEVAEPLDFTVAPGTNNFFLRLPQVNASTDAGFNSTTVRFWAARSGYAWAMVVEAHKLSGLTASGTMAFSERSNPLAGVQSDNNCTRGPEPVANSSYTVWELHNCTAEFNGRYSVVVYLSGEARGIAGTIGWSNDFTVRRSNTFHVRPRMVRPASSDGVYVEFACVEAGRYWMQIATRANASRIGPREMRSSDLATGHVGSCM
ncbi:hypothetical protein FOZ62_019372, partial [Perkinsus olseni]